MPTRNQTTRRPPWVWRIIRARPRLFTSFALGLAAVGILAVLTPAKPVLRILAGWDIALGVYIVLAMEMMARADVHQIRRRAAAQDDGAIVILVLTVATSLASLLGIVMLLRVPVAGGAPGRLLELAVACATITLSWAFIHTMFALHYAHEFYDQDGVPGLAFPAGEKEPDYWDFLYFAVVIGMTAQVADVGITSKEIRRTVTAHGVVSFFFNVALLALTVNIAASAM